MASPTHRISSLHLDDLEYAKNRIAQYNELPTKAQLLQFIFEVEARVDELQFASGLAECPRCGNELDGDDE
jgi:hypothetical protein